MPTNKYRCSEFNRVQIKLSNKATLCCLLPETDIPIDSIFHEKLKLNERIACGDFSMCGNCPNIYPVSSIGSSHIHTMDIFTSTLCPSRCFYCAFTEPNSITNIAELDKEIPPVAQRVCIKDDIIGALSRYMQSEGGKYLQSISLSGGDSAFYPEFISLVNLINEYHLKVIYLSFGVLPVVLEDFVVKKIKNRQLDLSISIDAVQSETWSQIKRKPVNLWDKVENFVKRAAIAANGDGVYLKFIVNKINYFEVSKFIPFWFSRGVKNFSVSAMHACTAEGKRHLCSPDEYSAACESIRLSFFELPLGEFDKISLTALDGLEAFFPELPLVRP